MSNYLDKRDYLDYLEALFRDKDKKLNQNDQELRSLYDSLCGIGCDFITRKQLCEIIQSYELPIKNEVFIKKVLK